MKRYRLFVAFAAVLSLVSCRDYNPSVPASGDFRLNAAIAAYSSGDAAQDDEWNEITGIRAYHFDDGVLVAVYDATGSGESGFGLSVGSRSGTLYIVAETSGSPSIGQVDIGMSETLWHNMTVRSSDAFPGMFYTGMAELSDRSGNNMEVSLERGLARLDLKMKVAGTAEVRRIVIEETALVSRLFGGYGFEEPEETDDMTVVPSEPFTGDVPGIAYLLEQGGRPLKIHVDAVVDGQARSLEAFLPENIIRNTVYSLTLRKDDITGSISIDVLEWEDGGITDMVPDFDSRLRVDVESSEIPSDVKVSDSRTALELPYLETDFIIAVDSPDELEMVSADGRLLDVQPVGVNRFRITKKLFPPGEDGYSTEIRFRRKGLLHAYPEDRIRLELPANPAVVSGEMDFTDGDYAYDFERYVENELGVVTVPQGKVVSAEFPEGEDSWFKVEPVGEGAYRIIGGWRPNDPKADGRTQEGRIVISSSDGSGREAYTVRRVNTGLPVVQIGGTWWARYNLRGNVKDIGAQIAHEDGPSDDSDQFGWLQTLTDDALLGVMGDQYQAGNQDGLPLRHDGTGYYYEGMVQKPGNFGLVDPTTMAPDGYRIPSYDDYAFLVPNDDYNLGGVGSRSYRNRTGETITVQISEREVSFLGHDYGTVAFYDFEYGGNHLVLYGLGHQWNLTTGNVAKMNLLLATWGDEGRTWALEGYASTDRPGQNWLKYASNNTTKTRLIRCVKTPVEYIY